MQYTVIAYFGVLVLSPEFNLALVAVVIAVGCRDMGVMYSAKPDKSKQDEATKTSFKALPPLAIDDAA